MIVSVSSANDGGSTPQWADGSILHAQLAPARVDDECDLGQRLWEKGLLVTQDKDDQIYVLDPEAGECWVYSPSGEEISSFSPSGWEPLRRTPIFTGFATSPSGDQFAAGTGNLITLFTPKKVQVHTTVESMISSVAFVDRDLVVAQLPFRFDEDGAGAIAWPYLLAWLDQEDATIEFEALEPDSARGPDPMVVGLTQSVEITSDPSSDLIWALDKHKLYRVRRLSSSGSLERTWTSDRVREPARFERVSAAATDDEVPEEEADEAGQQAIEENHESDETTTTVPINAPKIVWDAVARDGFLWVLLKVDGSTAIDVFDRDCQGPILRLRVDAGNQPVGNIAVVDDAVWVFPLGIAEGGVPTRYPRDEDWLIRQNVYGGGSER